MEDKNKNKNKVPGYRVTIVSLCMEGNRENKLSYMGCGIVSWRRILRGGLGVGWVV